MATGVLVVAVGEATKLVPWLTAHDKGYEATVALGVETDTLDAEGAEVRRVPPSAALCEALRAQRPETSPLLRAALEGERARTLQAPPAYSAIRTGGERAYARARRGERLELEPRPVVVRRLDLIASSAQPPSLEVALDVGKGYYVRALARDLADGPRDGRSPDGAAPHARRAASPSRTLTRWRLRRSRCARPSSRSRAPPRAPCRSRDSRRPARATRGTVGPCSQRTSRARSPL